MRPLPLVFALIAILAAAAPARAVDLVITYDPGAPFTATEEAVINEAAALWEARIIGSDVVSVSLRKVPLASTRLGFASSLTAAGASNSGLPISGTIEINSTISFFVDPTPGDHSEFLNNVSPPTLRPAISPGPADGVYDLLTLALHEFGHVLTSHANRSQRGEFPRRARLGRVDSGVSEARRSWLDIASPLQHISRPHDSGTPDLLDDYRGPNYQAHGDADVFDYGDIAGGV